MCCDLNSYIEPYDEKFKERLEKEHGKRKIYGQNEKLYIKYKITNMTDEDITCDIYQHTYLMPNSLKYDQGIAPANYDYLVECYEFKAHETIEFEVEINPPPADWLAEWSLYDVNCSVSFVTAHYHYHIASPIDNRYRIEYEKINKMEEN